MTRAYRLGLTGSVGMGKSTTARIFGDEGASVWDADAAVHRLYRPGGAGAAAVAAEFPGAVVDGAVDRAALRRIVTADPAALSLIETLIHPLVKADRAEFLRESDRTSIRLAVLEVPLLFETGADAETDGIAVVSVPQAEQRRRVLARPGMTEAAFAAILARQMPDAEKRKRATWVIETLEPAAARRQVREIVRQIIGGHGPDA